MKKVLRGAGIAVFGAWVLLPLVLVMGGCAPGVSGAPISTSAGSSVSQPVVKILDCKRSVIETAEVEYEITNSSELARSYIPEFEIMDSKGVRIGTAIAFENDVPPGKKVRGVAVGDMTGGDGKFTCVLKSA